jgi:hypothetical protein
VLGLKLPVPAFIDTVAISSAQLCAGGESSKRLRTSELGEIESAKEFELFIKTGRCWIPPLTTARKLASTKRQDSIRDLQGCRAGRTNCRLQISHPTIPQ